METVEVIYCEKCGICLKYREEYKVVEIVEIFEDGCHTSVEGGTTYDDSPIRTCVKCGEETYSTLHLPSEVFKSICTLLEKDTSKVFPISPGNDPESLSPDKLKEIVTLALMTHV